MKTIIILSCLALIALAAGQSYKEERDLLVKDVEGEGKTSLNTLRKKSKSKKQKVVKSKKIKGGRKSIGRRQDRRDRKCLKKKSGKCVKFSKGKKVGKERKGRKCLKRKCVSYTKRNSGSKKDRKGLKCLKRKCIKYEEENEIQDKDISKQTATCSQSTDNLRQKALSWLSKIKNLEKIRNGIKIENVRNESSSASQQFLATAKILGKFTKNGTSCSRDCGQSVCDAQRILSKCPETARNACNFTTYDFSKDSKRDSCKTDLEKFIKICSNSSKEDECCKKSKIIFNDTTCFYDEVLSDARKVRRSCSVTRNNGSYIHCMSLVKSSLGMIEGCWDSTTTTPRPTNPALTPDKKITTTKFVEDGTETTHTASFDPVLEEAYVIVPAHLNRLAVNIVVNKRIMVTSTSDFCLVEETPDSVDIETYSEPQKEATEDSNDKEYFVYEFLEEVSDTQTLSAAALYACRNRTIRKAVRVSVDDATFENLEKGAVVKQDTNSTLQGCSKTKRVCMSRSGNSWATNFFPLLKTLSISKVKGFLFSFFN